MVKYALKMIILDHRQFRLQITYGLFFLATQGITVKWQGKSVT